MKKITTILVLLFFPVVVFAESFPSFPMALWGSATVNSSAAPVGSIVKSYLGSSVVGQVTIQEAGIYGYTESTKQKLLIGNASGSLTFSIQHPSLNNGTEIFSTQTESFVSGSTTNKNLSFSFTTQQPSGGGGGGSSGGGGGGTSNQSSTSTQSNSKGDTNSDGKTDLLDFNMLMVNWGKNESNNPADLNKDGFVDIFDFNLLMINWSI